jgi:NAD-dependent SIR2 family protein deacetylase
MPLEPGSTSISEFHTKLRNCNRIVALCGAGLSAASGVPTFRTPGGPWSSEQVDVLTSPEKFETDPDLVWLFYSLRRHEALRVEPNPGHYALAALARERPEFLCLTQNIDGQYLAELSPAYRRVMCSLNGGVKPANMVENSCFSLE